MLRPVLRTVCTIKCIDKIHYSSHSIWSYANTINCCLAVAEMNLGRAIGRAHGSGASGGEVAPDEHAYAMAGWLMREGEMLTERIRGGSFFLLGST